MSQRETHDEMVAVGLGLGLKIPARGPIGIREEYCFVDISEQPEIGLDSHILTAVVEEALRDVLKKHKVREPREERLMRERGQPVDGHATVLRTLGMDSR